MSSQDGRLLLLLDITSATEVAEELRLAIEIQIEYPELVTMLKYIIMRARMSKN